MNLNRQIYRTDNNDTKKFLFGYNFWRSTRSSFYFIFFSRVHHLFIRPPTHFDVHHHASSLQSVPAIAITCKMVMIRMVKRTSNVPVSLAVSEKSSPSEPTFLASGDDGCDGVDAVVVAAVSAATGAAAASGKAVGGCSGTVDIFVAVSNYGSFFLGKGFFTSHVCLTHTFVLFRIFFASSKMAS